VTFESCPRVVYITGVENKVLNRVVSSGQSVAETFADYSRGTDIIYSSRGESTERAIVWAGRAAALRSSELNE
jgi:hypothetical protein